MQLRKLSVLLSLLLTLLLLTGGSPEQQNNQYSITVTAGSFDRVGTVVSFSLPEYVEAGAYYMERESDGETVLLQVNSLNKGWFILESLSAGSSETYILNLESFPEFPPAGVTKTLDRNTITFGSGGSKVLTYYHAENQLPEGMDKMYYRAGYIHPAYSPDGVQLTNHLDQKMHPHQYGIFTAWTSTEFQGRAPDFWNPHNHSGRVHHGDSLEVAWEGPVHGGLVAKNYYVDISAPAPVVALNEEWKVVVYNMPEESNYRIFDIRVTHTANTAHPLVLPEYRYGGMAFRGHGNWDNPDNVSFLTSEGHDRSTGNETRARWCHMGGKVDGKRAGIAVLGHPDNFRAPQPVRIHPDTPYFVYAPMQLGKMSIEPGSPYVMRYRYITYDGQPDPEQLDRLWNDYAYPPGVMVVTGN